MNNIKKTVLNIALALTACAGCGLTTSCSDWLDVRGENIEKEQDMFTQYKGFNSALVGVYMDMASTDAYGRDLTMTLIEDHAHLWSNTAEESSYPLRYYVANHNYESDQYKAAMKAVYAKLFNVITSANVIIKNAEAKPESFPSVKEQSVVLGEAYAIRAFCQLDVLRLFGQMPENAVKKVRLPYSETSSISEMPAYYDYAEYVAKLKSDLGKAESLLKDNDPVKDYAYQELNSSNVLDDTYMLYRQSRLNYWAVRALRARMLMYVGEKAEAAKVAREVIAAKTSKGESVVALSGAADLAKKFINLPSECLFYLSKYDVRNYAVNLLVGETTDVVARNSCYFVTQTMLNEMYESIPNATASHNRYINTWFKTAKDNYSTNIATCKKYCYSDAALNGLASSDNSSLVTKLQIIPMLRLSEMYLIAIEGASDVEEANGYYDTYMQQCAMPIHPVFASMDEAKAEVLNEYRREFIAEGQMFYTYKRNATKSVLWHKGEMGEAQYIIPLPATEYDPSTVAK